MPTNLSGGPATNAMSRSTRSRDSIRLLSNKSRPLSTTSTARYSSLWMLGINIRTGSIYARKAAVPAGLLVFLPSDGSSRPVLLERRRLAKPVHSEARLSRLIRLGVPRHRHRAGSGSRLR